MKWTLRVSAEPDHARLAGKVAVVTGASLGIGRSIAELFPREGATVIGLDIDPASPTIRRMDVTDERQWREFADEFEGSPPHVVVNNAGGLLDSSPLHLHSTETWRQTLDLNLTSVFFSMRAFIPRMLPF